MEENPAGTEPAPRTAPIGRLRRLRPVDDGPAPQFWEDVAEEDRPGLGDLGDRVQHFAGELLEADDDGTGLPRRIVWWAAASASVLGVLALLAVLVPVVRLIWSELWP